MLSLRKSRRAAASSPLVFASGLWLISGCFGGRNVPELVEVSGTVTLDGKPLPDATVHFVPIVQGDEETRPASGVTDEDGAYVLQYSTSQSGARPGRYNVRISTFRPEGEDFDGNHTAGVAEAVPSVYNLQTTLTAEVQEEGGEPIDFSLQSDAGRIVQPRPASDGAPSSGDGGSC